MSNEQEEFPDIQVKMRTLSTKEIWDAKEDLQRQERQSKALWTLAGPQKRADVLRVVRSTLNRLSENAELWVPYGLEIKQGSAVDLTVTLLFTDLEAELKGLWEQTQKS